MNPTQPQSKADGFLPKYRIFHPQSTVWVKNPFDHDVLYMVADEHNVQYQYRMKSGKISELPGGAIATLGVKAIVDELIQNDPKDALSMWEPGVRAKWETTIIERVKEAPQRGQSASLGGEVNLTASDELEDEEDTVEATEEAPIFPTRQEEVPDFAAATLAGKKNVELPADA